MNILLRVNLDKQYGLECARQLVKELKKLGAQPMLDNAFRSLIREEGCMFGPFVDLLPHCDVLMPVGGDGTVMRAAQFAVEADKPLVAVNAGRVGFLTQVERHEIGLLRLLVEGKYTVNSRMMLEAELVQDGEIRRFTALNDVVVRADAGRLADLEVHENEKLVATHRADGIIFATPTGSTAYSLSAGGPIVDPGLSLLVMTAICSHSPFNCSLVLPADLPYTISGNGLALQEGLSIWMDGQRVGKLFDNETVVVRRSPSAVRFVDLGQRDFYSNVNEKLTWGR